MAKRLLFLAALALLAAAGSAPAQAEGDDGPRVYASPAGSPLTGPSRAAPAAIATRFLREHGASAHLDLVSSYQGRGGITYLRFEQRVAGLTVAHAYARAALTERGELVHVIDGLAADAGGPLRGARADESGALDTALRHVHPGVSERPAAAGRSGNVTHFSRTPFFFAGPTVERVAVATGNGSFQTGFLVETWSDRENLLHETLVSGEGEVLEVERRTSEDSYNVFEIDPEKSPQTVVSGPGSTTASPIGWLGAGAHRSIDIAGNNAHGYLDADANNAPDAGGAAIVDGSFLAVWDGAVQPSASENPAVAVQNLFYLNNVLHDVLYGHGFVEGAGNFQEDNFGRGGRGSDSVNAEAQDGSGTDNANFATPRDGQNPRMQMFLWSPPVTHELVVHQPAEIAGTYAATGAAFGPQLDTTGVTGQVALANDGTAPTSDACEAITDGSVAGRIALIDRGTCSFTIKVKNAQEAGAIATIVVNNQGDGLLTMGGTDATITIASVFIGQTDGNTIRAGLSSGDVVATERAAVNPPPLRDSALDSDIVYHEYGHGLTWRMIGRMSGPMSGAVGEGMSDFLALLINSGDDRIGEYSFSDPRGIRRFPYSNYPNTYADFTGAEVHNDGEIYGAIGWRLIEIFRDDGVATQALFGYVVDGMNFTPAKPTFEEMRDGILQSVAIAGGAADACRIWEGFAQYGVGVGARATVRGSRISVTESFALPPECG